VLHTARLYAACLPLVVHSSVAGYPPGASCDVALEGCGIRTDGCVGVLVVLFSAHQLPNKCMYCSRTSHISVGTFSSWYYILPGCAQIAGLCLLTEEVARSGSCTCQEATCSRSEEVVQGLSAAHIKKQHMVDRCM